jgi:hypothetical protein
LSLTLRRDIPLLLVAVIVVLVIGEFFLVFEPLSAIVGELNTWCVILFAWAVTVGVVVVTRAAIKDIIARRGRWYWRVWTLITMYVWIIVGVYFLSQGDLSLSAELYQQMVAYIWTRVNVYYVIGFWVISAMYRTFRWRSLESSVLVTATTLTVLGQLAWLDAITPVFHDIRTWLVSVLNTAGLRPIIIATAFGVLLMGLRMAMGRERSYLGEMG